MEVFLFPHHNLEFELQNARKKILQQDESLCPLFCTVALLKGDFSSEKELKEKFSQSKVIPKISKIEKEVLKNGNEIYFCKIIHPLLKDYSGTQNFFIPKVNSFCFVLAPKSCGGGVTLDGGDFDSIAYFGGDLSDNVTKMRVFQLAQGTVFENNFNGTKSMQLETDKKIWVKIQ